MQDWGMLKSLSTSYAGIDDSQVEIAFLVHEDYQGLGIASYLLKELEKIALKNGYRSFCAKVSEENKAMLHVLTKYYPTARIHTREEGVEI